MTALKKILIVDDSQLIHNMYKLIMNRYQGCRIIDAMNGLEALDILSKGVTSILSYWISICL